VPRPDDATDEEIVVRRGDTLWAIAARHLGSDATDDEVARAWPRWWAANHAVIGDDPDRILPGQRLTPPPTQH
jgi:nucleoid-associated protein YgaU